MSYLPAGLSIIWSQSILQNNSSDSHHFWEGCCYYSSTWLSHSAFRALMTWDTEQPVCWIFLILPLATIPVLFLSGYMCLPAPPKLFLTNMETISLLFKGKKLKSSLHYVPLGARAENQQKLAIIKLEME